MTRASYALPIAALLAAAGARAAPSALTFEQSIYQDAKEGPLLRPEGVACNDAGAIVVADTGNGRLLTFAVKDGRLDGGAEVKLVQLAAPVRVEIERTGNALVLDAKTRRIVRVSAGGAYGGSVDLKGIPGAASVFPGSFKLDSADGLYILDVAGRRVLVSNTAGMVSRQVALPKGGEFTDIAVDAAGTIFAVDAIAAVVWASEKGSSAFSAITKSMKDRMNFPTHMLARQGKLFLVDQHGNGIVTLGIDGSYQGRQLSTGWSDGLVYYPSQLCVMGGGELFLADRNNNRVQYFTLVK